MCKYYKRLRFNNLFLSVLFSPLKHEQMVLRLIRNWMLFKNVVSSLSSDCSQPLYFSRKEKATLARITWRWWRGASEAIQSSPPTTPSSLPFCTGAQRCTALSQFYPPVHQSNKKWWAVNSLSVNQNTRSTTQRRVQVQGVVIISLTAEELTF